MSGRGQDAERDLAPDRMPGQPAPGDRRDAIVAVLCVDGRAEIQRCVSDLVVRALEPATVAVAVMSTTEDAIALLRSIRFDLVLSAYQVGSADGRKILEYLRAERPADVDRFVFFSGAEEARLLHPKTIEKGVRFEEFAAELRRLTAGQLPWPEINEAGST